ncbi:immunoglobulin-like and fibronectin type III domain-containing protein 1 isoform X2 [Alosa sapidissima]|uniref:immunoglobulin-like and fibronectin type III domain-containing protein 1 isoform X2 n=1 Tax=Alosa sapidissima TaxID=34773 RepID=UPI001C089CAC|nr:immunoglobulin-like and fibronectin type III domain-containing protein 1 isoform X2 [Alosa sapidissima]
MIKKSKVTDQTAVGQVGIKKRSKVPGVMVTQWVEEIPEGMTTPDFIRKPIALTIQEGKLALFKAVICGDPKPELTWRRAKGELSDEGKFEQKYDETTGEYSLVIPKVTGAEADTYKCYAHNEYGKAVCTATLNVIEVGFKKNKVVLEDIEVDPAEFRKMLRKRKGKEKEEQKRDAGEVDEKFWEILMSADKKDYERICAEFGVTNFRWMLKKLNEIKKEREEEQKMYVEAISNLKHIEVKANGSASFQLDLELKDPASRIFLYKDGVMIPYTDNNDDTEIKHSLKRVGKTLVFSVKDLLPEDAGLYQVDVEEVNMFSTDFKIPMVDFIVKLQEVKAKEREDALFECVLSHPFGRIQWLGKNVALEDGNKYSITMSDDKLIHRLLVKDCMQLDKGIYCAIAGIKTCSAWLIVEADSDPANKGKKVARKTTQAGGAGVDLEKLAQEQQEKLVRDREEAERLRAEAAQAVAEAADGADGKGQGSGVGDGSGKDGSGKDGSGKDGSGKDGSGKDGSGKDGSGKDGSGKDGSGKDGSGKDGSGKDGSGHGTDVDGSKLKGKGNSDGSGKRGANDGSGLSKGKDDGKDSNDNLNKDSLNDGIDPNAQSGQINEEGKDGKRAKRNKVQLGPDKVTEGSAGDAGGYVDDGVEVWNQKGTLEGGLTDLDSQGGQSKRDGAELQDSTADARAARRRARQGSLMPETVIDPGVQFVSGLSDVTALLGQPAELTCKLSSEQSEGAWYKDGKKLSADGEDGVILSKDGPSHKLLISKCEEEHSGRYRFEAEGRKSEATLYLKDPPRFNSDDLGKFSEPVIVRVGQNAVFKLPFEGRDPMKIQWYREGEELLDDTNVKIEKSLTQSRLLLSRCQRKESGEIKFRLRNEFGTTEAFSKLIVLDKPGPPQGPVEIVEASSQCIEIKWRPPKDDGGSPVKNYMVDRQQIGRNTWTKIGEIPGVSTYKDTNVDHGRKYCYRIRAITEEGISEMMETDDIMAGTLAFPGQPAAPKVASAFKDCINLTWTAPGDTGGSRIVGYNLEKRKKGSNVWSAVNPAGELIPEKKYAVKDVIAGMEYEFRVTAINVSGPSEPSPPSEFGIARDPKKPPGKVIDLRVTETTYITVSITWTKPDEQPGVMDEAKGYFVEVRPAESLDWQRSNPTPIILTSYTIKGLKAMAMYWVRVIAMNEGGDGVPTDLDNYVLAIPPPVRPKFTSRNMQSFMVVCAGNTVRLNLAFEASPWPDVDWLKDGVPVTKRATISNSDGGSQLLIPSSERTDTGIYTIVVKNMVGQETFSIEVRVTDEPKPPGPIELEENVPGTVTVVWEPSPDEKRDDRLHYMVSQRDSTKRTWHTVADRLFNNKFTACNIMQGREYHFRVYAKNDMGLSSPSESPTWGTTKQKGKFVVNMPDYKTCNFQCAPAFLVPLKVRTAPKGYECYMSCAVKGNPLPRITWYHNNVSLNTNTNYLISNICGVCSILILRVGPRDEGEYTITVENPLGRAESSIKLNIRE